MKRAWRRFSGAALLLSVLIAPAVIRAQTGRLPAATPQYGPAHGTLMIIGGNMQDGSGLASKFIALAGGPTKRFVIVPTNGRNKNPDGTLKTYDPRRCWPNGRSAD